MEFNENLTGSKISMPSGKYVFFGPMGKTRWPPGLWLAETFSTSPLKPLRNSTSNLTGSKISTSSTNFVFFGPIGKTRWPPRPLIGWDIFDFSSETTERNSTKLEGSKILTPSTKFVFYGGLENQDGCPGLWWAETFSNSLKGIQRNLTWSKISMPSSKCVFLAFGKIRWPPRPLIGWDIFYFSSETAERNSTKLDRKQDLKVLYQVFVFLADLKNKMAAQASDWLRHFRLLLWIHCTEFNLTWQEARSQSPLNTKFEFFGPIGKTPPASDWPRHIRLLLWNRWTEFNKTWLEARSQHLLPSLCFSGWCQETKIVALADLSKRWHIVLKCTICGPLGLLFIHMTYFHIE